MTPRSFALVLLLFLLCLSSSALRPALHKGGRELGASTKRISPAVSTHRIDSHGPAGKSIASHKPSKRSKRRAPREDSFFEAIDNERILTVDTKFLALHEDNLPTATANENTTKAHKAHIPLLFHRDSDYNNFVCKADNLLNAIRGQNGIPGPINDYSRLSQNGWAGPGLEMDQEVDYGENIGK